MPDMKAMEFTGNGEARLVEIPKPEPNENEILVRVKFSALDTATDSVLQRTWMGSFTHAKITPLILGWHFSGTVEKIGAKVTDLKVDDQVFGHLQYDPSTKQGTFSEYVTVPADACALKPDKISHDVAAASTTESMTALQAMRDLGGLSKGKSVLVIGAGGGVGTAAVPIAKKLGANVTAVCSEKDIHRVKALGADKVMDRSLMDPLSTDAKYDVIFDTPCAYSAIKCTKKLNKKGTYVTPVPSWSLLGAMFLSLFNRKSAKFVPCKSKREDLDLVGKWLEEGLQVEIDSTFPIKDLTGAVERQRDRSKTGRVVIQVDGGWP